MISVNLIGGEKSQDGKLIGGSITGSANGKTYGVKYTEEKYKKMLDLAAKANEADSMEDLQNILADFEPFMHDGYKETVETACPNLLVNEETGKFYLKTTDGTVISSKPLPQALVDRILISVEKGIDFLPLVKFWTRALRLYSQLKHLPAGTIDRKLARLANYVNKTTVDYELKAQLEKDGVAPAIAYERATVYQTPITQEGLLCTYKWSTEILHKFDAKEGKKVDRYAPVYDEDTGEKTVTMPEHVEDRLFEPAVQGQSYDPFYCYFLADALKKGKPAHFIRVGRVHELEKWEQVNTNDDASCRPGLHVGNLDYIQGYGGSGKELHDVFVDPMDIGAVTDDGSGALRVRRYFVHRSNAGINKGIYHSSKFASMTDLEWSDFREAAIKESEAKAEEAKNLAAEQAAL